MKKYANRRLYNTESSSYVTLEDLAQMVRQGRRLRRLRRQVGRGHHPLRADPDHRRGGVEGRANLLPTSFLRQIIGFYGDSMQSLVPRYLESVMGAFSRQQDQMRRAVEQTMGGFIPFGGPGGDGQAEHGDDGARHEPVRPLPRREDGNVGGPLPEAEAMRAEIDALRQELARLRAAKAKEPG